jgi:DNA-binding response OmpR family regulator
MHNKLADRPHSIIVVEDNLAVREALCMHLVQEGFDVRGAPDGPALTAALAQGPADALVLDLNLPLEDGMSIATRVRQAYPAIGILVLSGRVVSSDQADTYRASTDLFLTKPVSPDQLTAALRGLCCRPAA